MKHRNSICTIIVALLFTSCGGSFLDKDDPYALTYDKMYHTEAEFQAAVNGCYFNLKGLLTYLLTFNEVATDNAYLHKDNNTTQQWQFDRLTVASNAEWVKNFWNNSYKTIASTNIVLTRIGKSEVPEASKKVFTSEAKFIRALSYFNMVRVYGGVPVYTQEVADLNSTYNVGRSSVEDVYKLIIEDLESAVNIDAERSAAQQEHIAGKVNSTAVKTLLAKVYMFIHNYNAAIPLLKDIIEHSGKDLIDLNDLYNPDTPINNEVIFAVNFERVNGQNNPFSREFLPKYSTGIVPIVDPNTSNGDGIYNIEDNIVASFEAGDKRRSLIKAYILAPEGGTSETFYYSTKYLDLNATLGTPFNSASDFIFLRYADVLLMMADAENQTNGPANAYQYVNKIRNRAGLEGLPTGLTKESMNDVIASERQKEFLCEADRWFDLSFRGFDYLKKTLNAFFPVSHTTSAVVKEHMNVFPLPDEQVNLKEGVLEQNPGY